MRSKNKIAPFHYCALIEPVCANMPCGPNLEYDPAFLLLQSITATRPDIQFGDFVGTPAPINWGEVERNSLALLQRTKDVRLIILLIRSGIRLRGAAGLHDGLMLLDSMLEQYPEDLHPTLVFEGQRDPLMRANALAGLADHSGVLTDMRNISLPKAAGLKLQLRDIESALSLPRTKGALPAEGINRSLKELAFKRDHHFLALVEAAQITDNIICSVNVTLDDCAPDLCALYGLLRPFFRANNRVDESAHATMQAEAVAPISPSASVAENNDTGVDIAGQSQASQAPMRGSDIPLNISNIFDTPQIEHERTNIGQQQITDRWSALVALQGVRDWFERNEPSSPVIVLLRQGERMVGKRFSELAHIIPSDLLAKWDAPDN
ncbi:type VI secretion system protein TssA [Glaciimonas immobilis]|uniref:Type VI secretion system protein ImpA n=1 Tax=Glaciimonas immobilis TaxID=728004 RepID=A0A840RQ25_9BURK|nr:type VI secretion system ImpA family N-terminal domain-containing protein [Glaciimonas immobilis]KAF3998068.1 hypothetical protein HAV38_10970 [Glaciimonas immobilis]MBB5199242.1 type VI secretion system protein ImpA [Glaciimonas immobilis]